MLVLCPKCKSEFKLEKYKTLKANYDKDYVEVSYGYDEHIIIFVEIVCPNCNYKERIDFFEEYVGG